MKFSSREFIDREPQLQNFQALLDPGTVQRVLLFHGPPGIGKTWLAERLCVECRSARTQFALLDFELGYEHKSYKIADVIAGLQRQIGGEFSARIGTRIRDLERDFVSPSPLEQVFAAQPEAGGPALRASAESIQADLGDIGPGAQVAVGQQIFQNVQFYMNPHKEPALIRQQKQLGLDQIFREELENLLAQRPLVLLFDSCDAAQRDVLDWLQHQLIEPLIQGRLAHQDHLSLVVTGALEGKRGRWVGDLVGWSWGIVAHKLGNLLPKDVQHWWVHIRALSVQTLPPVFLQLGSAPKLMSDMAQLTAQMEAGRSG